MVGISFSSILLLTGVFFTYTNWSNSTSNAQKYYIEQAQVNATGAKMRTYRAIGTVRTLSIAIDNLIEERKTLQDSAISHLLNDVTQRLTKYNDITLYHAAYISLDRRYLQAGNGDGRATFISTEDKVGMTRIDKPNFDQSELDQCLQRSETERKTAISRPYMSSYPNGSPSAFVASISAPIEYKNKVIGSVAVDIPLQQLQRIIKKTEVPEGASAYLISHDGQVVAHTNDAMNAKPLPSDTDPKLMETIQSITHDKNNQTPHFVDLNGKSHFVVPVNVDQTYTTWAFGLSIPNNELYKKARTNTLISILVSLVGLAIGLALSRFIATRITEPINEINQSINKLGKGEVKSIAKLNSDDQTEIGQIYRSMNNLIDSLGSAVHFAFEIGKGNFNENLARQSDNDDISNALIEMKESLIRSKEQEQQRQQEEQINNWANEGVAKFSEILRSNHTDIKELSHQIISNLVRYLGINQGGLFVQNDSEKQYLDMTACFAYSRRKMMEQRFEVNEGLVGRCFVEAEPIYLLEVPESYITITSGLGDTPPRCLLLVPLKVDGEVNGVIELASLEPIAEYKVKFVEKVAESIASTLKNVRINEHTAKLLEQTKIQAEEMAAAEEEMRQNLEELQSTQEEMARVQEEQKRAMDKVTTDNQMFEALLRSTSEYVYFKDSSGRYVKASDSARMLLGVDRIEEALGKTAFDLFPADVAQEIDKEDQAVMKSQTPLLKQQGKLTYKDGTTKTVEKNKYPVKNTGQEVVGLISIYKEV